MMHLKIRLLTVGFAAFATCAFAGGEVQQAWPTKQYRTVPPPVAAPPPAAPAYSPPPAPSAPTGRGIEGSGIRAYSGQVVRNMPMPAPSRRMGAGKEYHEFYGPTYYYPSEHNVYEGLHPQYYPFINQKGWPNYKVPGDYCAGKLCGPSASMYYWDSYDDWKRGQRYEQHQ